MVRASTKRARIDSEEEGETNQAPAAPYQGNKVVIKFKSENSRERFMSLEPRLKTPTRCVGGMSLSHLKLAKEFNWLCKQSGCFSLARLNEPTYKELTLEFLSSFELDAKTRNVSYRINNKDFNLGMDTFGEILNVSSRGASYVVRKPRETKHDAFWESISGEAKFTKMRTKMIQHPVIRFFMRALVDVYFGRDEINNLTSIEVDILMGAIGPTPFKVNMAFYIADHLHKIGHLGLKDVKVGGLITHIAKAHMKKDPSFVVKFKKLTLVEKFKADTRTSPDLAPVYSCDYLKQLGYIKEHDMSDTRHLSYW